MSEATVSELANQVCGPVWAAGRGDHAGYDEERRGFNLALDQRPAIALGAATAADIVTGIRFASDQGLGVSLQATGHGANSAMDDGLLINTRRLVEVAVDPASATARVAAGATSAAVMAAAARYGLAALVGGAPSVGFVSYTLGGGLGPLGRAYGYAADHVRRLDVVTAGGRQLTVTSEHRVFALEGDGHLSRRWSGVISGCWRA